jgi:hypothetical protein
MPSALSRNSGLVTSCFGLLRLHDTTEMQTGPSPGLAFAGLLE